MEQFFTPELALSLSPRSVASEAFRMKKPQPSNTDLFRRPPFLIIAHKEGSKLAAGHCGV